MVWHGPQALAPFHSFCQHHAPPCTTPSCLHIYFLCGHGNRVMHHASRTVLNCVVTLSTCLSFNLHRLPSSVSCSHVAFNAQGSPSAARPLWCRIALSNVLSASSVTSTGRAFRQAPSTNAVGTRSPCLFLPRVMPPPPTPVSTHSPLHSTPPASGVDTSLLPRPPLRCGAAGANAYGGAATGHWPHTMRPGLMMLPGH